MSRIEREPQTPEESVAKTAHERLRKAQETTETARLAYFAAGRDTLAERRQAYDLANNEEVEAELAFKASSADAHESRKPSERRRPASGREGGNRTEA